MTTHTGEGSGQIDGGVPPTPLEILHNAPGIDPVLATINGDTEALAQARYLVSANVRPGVPLGKISIKHFGAGGFQPVVETAHPTNTSGNRSAAIESGTMSANFRGYTEMWAAVENNRAPLAWENHHTRYGDILVNEADTLALSTKSATRGDTVLLIRKGVGRDAGTMHTTLHSQYNSTAEKIDIQRTLTDISELPALLDALVKGMALTEADQAIVVEAIMAKIPELNHVRKEQLVRQVLGGLAIATTHKG